jgi:Sperm-tail PG-rich repeat
MSWSVSRTIRFPYKKRRNNTEFINLPSTLNPRATGMGFGKKLKIQNVGGVNSPPPGTYNLPAVSGNKGPKFAKSNRNLNKIRFSTPGPGAYELLKPLGKDRVKFSLKSRIPIKYDSFTPSPADYTPVHTLTQYSGFQNISFGIGERKVLQTYLYNVPGPGTYETSSRFST